MCVERGEDGSTTCCLIGEGDEELAASRAVMRYVADSLYPTSVLHGE